MSSTWEPEPRGIPLAILRPDLAVTLVEPLQKRVALLRMTAGKLRRWPLTGAERRSIRYRRARAVRPEHLDA